MAKEDKKPKGERQKQLEDEPYLGEETEAGGGSAGGNLQRKVGSRDTLKRAFERPAGASRVRKSDKRK